MKTIFTAKQLLASCAFVFLLGSCAPDAEVEPTVSTTELSAAASTKGKGSTGSKDEEVGSMRYMLITEGEVTTTMTTEVTLAGGTIEEVNSNIGLIKASSTAPDFATKAAAIKGIRSVLKDSKN